MDRIATYYVTELVRVAKVVDHLENFDIADHVVARLKQKPEICAELYERFKEHAANATVTLEFEGDIEVDGPLMFPDTAGYYYHVNKLQSSKPRPNADYIDAAEILNLAAQLDCNWVEDARTEFEQEHKLGGKVVGSGILVF